MNKDKENLLFNDFPEIFQDRHKPMSKSCMCWGMCCGDGWYQLIRDICEKMEAVRMKSGIQFIADQVKEKFGSLRFYYSDDGRLLKLSEKERKKYCDEIQSFVNKKEGESESICEECGRTGTRRNTGWIKTLCDVCNSNRYNGNV